MSGNEELNQSGILRQCANHLKQFFTSFQDMKRYATNCGLPTTPPTEEQLRLLASECLKDAEKFILEKSVRTSTNRRKEDMSIYTGLGGFAVALSRSGRNIPEHVELAKKCIAVAEGHSSYQSDDYISYYIGRQGIITVKAEIASFENDTNTLRSCVRSLCLIPKNISSTEDELLLGKAGFLYCILKVRTLKGIEPESMKLLNDTATVVANLLLDDSKTHSKDKQYLQYECYGTLYCGAAHGTVGVLHVLLHAWDLLKIKDKDKVVHTLKKILSSKESGKNLPMAIGESDASIYHWCHGAPGLIPVLITASRVLEDDSYLKEAIALAPVVAKFGLVLKGNSLCHGIAGNAYAFLSLYKATNNVEFLTLAHQFYHAMSNSTIQSSIAKHPVSQRKVIGIPDMPYSLMEGSAGVACFAIDLLDPLKAAFPGWEIE